MALEKHVSQFTVFICELIVLMIFIIFFKKEK